MEVAYTNRVDPQSPAGRVPGPRPKGGGQEDDHDTNIRPPPNGNEQGGVKAADQQGEYWGWADIHAPSIRTQAVHRTMKRPPGNPARSWRSAGGWIFRPGDPAATENDIAAVEDRRLPGRSGPDRIVGPHRPPAVAQGQDRGRGDPTAVPYLHFRVQAIRGPERRIAGHEPNLLDLEVSGRQI